MKNQLNQKSTQPQPDKATLPKGVVFDDSARYQKFSTALAQADKAPASLLEIVGLKICEIGGDTLCKFYADTITKAPAIVRAVNEHGALCAVAEAADDMYKVAKLALKYDGVALTAYREALAQLAAVRK